MTVKLYNPAPKTLQSQSGNFTIFTRDKPKVRPIPGLLLSLMAATIVFLICVMLAGCMELPHCFHGNTNIQSECGIL